jgi:acyl carrier protein
VSVSAQRSQIRDYVLRTLQELSRDWEYSKDITEETGLFADLGFESLDAVVLGTSIQEHYRRPMPFAELLADIGQREVRELTIGELVSFIERHVAPAARNA